MTISSHSDVVLITGANQGLGFELSRRLASDYPGYHILMGSRDTGKGDAAVDILKPEGLSVEAINIDVTDEESIKAAAAEVESKFGRLDVLVNNAGIVAEGKMPTGTSLQETFRACFDVNAFGPFLVTEAFTPLLKKSHNPRVVFMSTGLGSITDRLNPDDQCAAFQFPVYRSSKAALNMIMAHYAALYAKDGWKVNANDPGFCATNLNSYRGWNTPESGVVNAVRLVTLGTDGPTGTFSCTEGPVNW
ncbi:carbonyl reductase [Penicillium cataractarum]|uniref:Carbonyl reductase n=1 Tax=Penicillium cataractarum TaxID=2100454 RepID=A0A9W9SN55_9EURO|nr:carbonyl reductase [Penicillium cataractarum]KAJ5380359.1 carbonyl reductase [Penicillium cataractarum]